MALMNERAEPASDVSRTMLFHGSWCLDGGAVLKVAEYAVLRSCTGLSVMLDRRAVELAAMALGIEMVR